MSRRLALLADDDQRLRFATLAAWLTPVAIVDAGSKRPKDVTAALKTGIARAAELLDLVDAAADAAIAEQDAIPVRVHRI